MSASTDPAARDVDADPATSHDDDADQPLAFRLLDEGLVPEPVLARVIDLRVARLVDRHRSLPPDVRDRDVVALRRSLDDQPITVHTAAANAQHYEVPTAFFRLVLGPHLKYSSGLWSTDDDLGGAERRMLDLTLDRAGLADGQVVLDLGCGWGSVSLLAAERFPASRIVGVSNSRTQREFVLAEAAARGLDNLDVVTADIATFTPADAGIFGRVDRIVSVEMLEHVRNHRRLFARVADWLADDGAMFVHVFSGRDLGFAFDADDPTDWVARYFFSGGLMPSDDLLLHRQQHLVCTDHWWIAGHHYQRTALAWLDNLHAHRDEVLELFTADVGADQARAWYRRWAAFFLTVAGLWGHDGGRTFGVSHYRFTPRPTV
ncbi:SAM-dependent methyltransferase [Salsipaludibacter albus]|uniref:SAM-dependent methyltransferase n=1 Tax=Salsipaludibacter albus TaxID=2849650 RepID=UPI001EE4D145|nr:cyclopropane-fatty-acyl-phospholipid synthase family protein [Salsipaludibacter albus]